MLNLLRVQVKSCLSVYLFFVLFLLIPAEVDADPIIYLEWVEDPTTTMIVNWVESSGSSTLLEYRERDSGVSWSSVNANEMQLPNTSQRRFQAKINGLSPGSSYEFRISSIPGTRYFRTAPANNEEPVRFLIGGDLFETRVTGDRFEELKQVFEDVTELAATYNPLFLVVGGDYVHTPDDYPDVEHWFYLLSTFTEKLVTADGNYQIPMIGSLGNHDVPEPFENNPDDAIYFHGFFSYPQEQWGQKRGYGVMDFMDYLSIITLDSNHTHSIRSQNNWLNNALLERSNVAHVYPVYHISGWPVFRSFRGELVEEIRNEWHPIFRDNGVRFVFEHHEHIYKRTYAFECEPPILNRLDCIETDNGVINLGGGSWGSGVRNTHPNYITGGYTNINEVIEEQNNFVLMEITNKKRSMQAISLNSGVIDSFEEVFFLPPPVVLESPSVSSNSFIAAWEPVNEADHYRLDVSTDSNFSTFVDGYDDRRIEVDEITEFEVDGLIPGQVYYYRMRARTPPTISDNSNVIQVETVGVDGELSSMEASASEAEANGLETVTITVTARDEDGNELRNAPVEISAIEGNLETDIHTASTNSEGQAFFDVRNSNSEVVVYQAVAAGTTITQTVSVSFLPEAPVALAATDVGTKSFTANWEVVNTAEFYFLDVSTDSSFSGFVDPYDNLNAGNVTSYNVVGLHPGVRYYYRVRSGSGDLRGMDSQTIHTVTFPETPNANEPANVSATWFTASWESAEGAANYLLEISVDSDFNSILEEYDRRDVGNSTKYRVPGLDPESNYFYRVRAQKENRTTSPSNTVQLNTLNISTDNSEVISEQQKIFANGEQKNQIEVVLKSDEGIPLSDVAIELVPQSGRSDIEVIQAVSDDEGRAIFSVTNTDVESVTYDAFFRNMKIGKVTVEFIRDEGLLSLGANFPNPFNDNTIIPVTIPRQMHVELDVYNSLGGHVQTIYNGELNTGYHEIPFNGSGYASGIYFYRLVADGELKTGNMVLVK